MSDKKVTKTKSHIRKHSAPTKLGWLIEMVRQLPTGPMKNWTSQRLKDNAKELAKQNNYFADLNDEDVELSFEIERIFGQLMKEAIEGLPGKVRRFVGHYPAKSNPFDLERIDIELEVRWRYDLLVSGKEILYQIAGGALSDNNRLTLDLPQEIGNENGMIELKPSGLSAYLAGAEIARIRECPICKKIFWAERRDQPTCTQRCNERRWNQIQRGLCPAPKELKGE